MRLTKKLWLLFACLMVLVNSIVYLNFFVRQEEIPIVLGEELFELTDEIIIGKTVDAVFEGNDNMVREVNVFFSTYNRTNHGTLRLTLYDDKDMLCCVPVDMTELNDNDYHRFVFPYDQLHKAQYYRLVLSSDSHEKSVSAWRDKNGYLVANITTINRPSVLQLFITNITYAFFNYVLCITIKALRRR